MGSKAAARELRKAEKLARFEASKAETVARIAGDSGPRAIVSVPTGVGPRLAPHIQREIDKSELVPKSQFDGSRFDVTVSWCISKADRDGEWSWGEMRDWGKVEWDSDIQPKMDAFASLSWGEIDRQTSESGHKMHHGHEIGDLAGEAQDRWREIGLEEFDSVFRFRVGATKRVWGHIVQAHFHMVWWERAHKIYEVAE